MTEQLSSMAGKAGDYFKSEDFKKILPYLLSGGAGALAGGVLTGRRKEREGEGRLSHIGRVLTNALITGGLAAGGHALINKGLKKTVGATDSDNPWIGSEENQGPAVSATKNVLSSPLTAAGTGLGALALTRKRSLIGAGGAGQADAAEKLRRLLNDGTDEFDMRTASPSRGADIDRMGSEHKSLRQRAGMPSAGESGSKSRAFFSNLSRRGLGGLFGQTWPRRSFRGALGLSAAALPLMLNGAMSD